MDPYSKFKNKLAPKFKCVCNITGDFNVSQPLMIEMC